MAKTQNNQSKLKENEQFSKNQRVHKFNKQKLQNKNKRNNNNIGTTQEVYAKSSLKLKTERELIKREKEERIQTAKAKRMERAKILNKKTKNGQPLMKCRMEYLLKQIQDMKSRS